MYLLERQLKILEYLKSKNDFVTGNNIAKYLNISDRTVRNEINAIKKNCGENIIIAVRTKGYIYNKEYDKLSTYHNVDVVSPNDRLLYILKHMIISNSHLDIYDIADQLFISERSIETDVSRINKILSELDLKNIAIVRTNSYIQLKNTYSVNNNILYDIAKYNLVNLNHSDFQKIFPNINMDYLSYLVIEILNNHKHTSRYLSYTRFIIDIAMFIEASNYYNHHLGMFYKELIEPFKKHFTDYYKNIAKDITNMVLDKFGTQLSLEDEDYMNYILYINHEMHAIEIELSKTYGVEDEFHEFCMGILEELRIKKGISFIDDGNELIKDLILHLRIAMKRVELGIKLYNPMITNVTTKYMHLIDIAIMIADSIEDKYDLRFSFNEISYIGIYLATAFHDYYDTISFDSKLNILLYIPEGIGSLNLINRQIERIVDKNKIDIDCVTHLPLDSEFNSVIFKYNLIITTSKRFDSSAKNVFILNKAFDINYHNKIKEIIDKELVILEQTKLNNLVREFTNKKLFISNLELYTKKDVICYLSNMLMDYGVVNEEFEAYVFAREEIVGTDLDTGIAFPHSLKNMATQSVMAIAVLKEPILWSTKKVNIVCMYANGLENSNESNLFIQQFMEVVFDDSFGNDLRKAHTYEDCVSALLNNFKTF